ncbi:MAG TPA: adenylate/guanylate cyclase domain-containing protein, partial [Methylomirabilota bacterium]|nr:adenylate/guanylate cyclase domain-containing protein [Methylomirabilota bacterium]
PASAPPAAPTPPAPTSYTPKHLADKILKSRSALEGERRQVTVLFADMVGFTSLAEKLDPEEVHRVINDCFEVITAEVHRFEGTINQYTGDGVMALFGAPIAHEDSARRAVHAALGIQRALVEYSDRLRAERGLTVAMRIGLNTGPVVVGRIGDDLRMDYTAVGDTTNLAARMQQTAEAGTVVVTEATHRAVEGFFETRDLGRLAVKGHEAVRAFQVQRSRGARSRIEVGSDRGLTPFVGRERELALLLDRFREAAAGHGQVVFVAGEAGIGKSRLLHELRHALDEQALPATWLEGQCVSFGQSIPFLPLTDMLRKNFAIEEFDGEPEIIAKVEGGTQQMGELAPHVPFLRYFLSVDPGDPAIIMMDAATRRRSVFTALRALALRGAGLRPLVLVIEDLHWMDTSSEEYLGSLIDSMGAVPLMLVLTYRLGYTPPFHTRSFQSAISLSTLGEGEAMAVARGVLGAGELPREVTAALMDKAEGVPLFIEEVAKTLLDIGVLRREGDRVTLVKGADGIRVPGTIHDIIMARLDRLGDEGKRAVQLASVIGREFLVRLLRRVTGMTEQLDGLLRELQSLELIYEKGLLPEPAYIFKHAVIQDVAYNSLLRERRRALHRAVGHALEELYPDRLADHYEELAHHFSQGEEWAKAFDYLVHSGDRARDANANPVALDLYARALEAAAHVPATPRARLAEVHQRRCQILTTTQRLEEAHAEARQMLALAREAGDRRLEGEAMADIAYAHYMSFTWDQLEPLKPNIEQASIIAREIGDGRLLARSLFVIGSVDQMEAKLGEAEANLSEAIRIAEAGGFPGVIVQARALVDLQRNWQGDFAGSITRSHETEAAARAAHDGFNEVLAMSNRGFAQIAHGDYREAFEVLTTGRDLARERDNQFVVGRMTNTLGWLYQEFGDFTRAQELDRESEALAKRIKNGNVETSALINQGFDSLHLGDPARALRLFEETLVRAEKAFGAHRWRWSMHLRFGLALALRALDRDGEAAALAARGLRQAEETGSTKYAGWFHNVQGELALRAGQTATAVAELERALDIARRIGFPTLTWQSAHLLAQAHVADRPDEALSAATRAADTIERMEAAAPEPQLRQTLRAWPRVQAVYETLDRLRRGA